MKSFLALIAAAFLGGGAALGVGTAIWDDGGTTTVINSPSASDSSLASQTQTEAIPDTDTGIAGRIYKAASPGVVQVTSNVVSQGGVFGQPQQGQSLGSGFVIDKAGHILTNFHVVDGAKEVFVNFSGNDRYKVKIIGTDPSTDLAVLQIDAQSRALTPLPLGNSDAIQVGAPVVAIGNPFGLDRTVTAGIVSALQREIVAPNGFTIDKVIQTDASINKGNSGGPLLDAEGKVIGINSQIETGDGSTGNVGIGFAVPINTVREVATEIMKTGRAEHAYLGVKMQTIDETLAKTARLPAQKGVILTTVQPGSPAAEAGLKGGTRSVVVDGTTYTVGGDVITKADGRQLESADELRDIVTSKDPGDKLSLEVHRDGSTETVTVTLGSQPPSAS
ncbi:MAG TPA: trypsin-like peptidase domain-containing protein [Gaiellaceae bacterium]|nr:trypsin-like peptidase domain-containing protein [Gaiellaceae bacterium]